MPYNKSVLRKNIEVPDETRQTARSVSEGKRTAWLRPFLKSLAILRMAALPWGFRARPVLDLYHGISQRFLKQTAGASKGHGKDQGQRRQVRRRRRFSLRPRARTHCWSEAQRQWRRF